MSGNVVRVTEFGTASGRDETGPEREPMRKAYKFIPLVLLFGAMLLLVVSGNAQENSPWHYSNCPAATNCCAVPVPQINEPVPGGRPTTVPQAAINLYGAHVSNGNAAASYLQFFNATAPPAAGTVPIGASSWFIAPSQDRDLVIGELHGLAFTTGIMACCSSTQETFTSVGGCGFLLQWY